LTRISNRVKPLDRQPVAFEWYSVTCDEQANDILEVNELLNPGVKVSAEITKITKITQEMVTGKPKFASIADRIIEQLETADVIAAHNLSYDLAILDFEMRRINKKYPLPKTKICTVEMSEHLFGYRLTLTALHEALFGEQFSGSHRAREDVQALKRCYYELMRLGEI
jgi:DNA polymerase-3 subunit epsilon